MDDARRARPGRVGAVLPALVGLIAALAALRTFRLRRRIAHADQWRRRVQYGLDLAKNDSISNQVLGSPILATLDGPKKPWVFKNPNSSHHDRGAPLPPTPVAQVADAGNVFRRLAALRRFRKSLREDWRVSSKEAALLVAFSQITTDNIASQSSLSGSAGFSGNSSSTPTREAIRDGIVNGLRTAGTAIKLGSKLGRSWWK